jgi:hypothetical protein
MIAQMRVMQLPWRLVVAAIHAEAPTIPDGTIRRWKHELVEHRAGKLWPMETVWPMIEEKIAARAGQAA